VIGVLLSSTLLDQIVTPALFFKFGRGVYEGRYGQRPEGVEEVETLRIAAQFD